MTTLCFNCDKELVPESITRFDENEEDYQFDNVLWIGFFGGYRMFVESSDYVEYDEKNVLKENGASYSVVICHECAHDLCEKFPKLGKLIEPYNSHSHNSDFWKNNPEHEGWDNPRKR